MLRQRIAASAALLALGLAGATTAEARPIAFGSSDGASTLDCGVAGTNDCTVTGLRIPASGRLTSVRIGHGLEPDGGVTTLQLKLMRRHTDGDNYVLVRDIGTPVTVAEGTRATAFSGLAENVTEGQFLAYFVNNTGTPLAIGTDAGPGIEKWPGEVTTDTTQNQVPVTSNGGGPNMSAVVRTPPVTTIDSGPAARTQDTGPTFAFSADETPVTFACELDDAPVACAGGSFTASGLAEGAHTFRVRATNDIGQRGAFATSAFTVDRTAPDTVLLSGPANTETTDRRPTWHFGASEEGRFECSVDDEPFAACPALVQPIGPLSFGTHRIRARAIDVAGNVDGTPLTFTITIKPSGGGDSGGGGGTPAPPTPAPLGPASDAAFGIPFGGTEFAFDDPVDGKGGPASDLASVRVVYDAAGRAGVHLRYHGAGERRAWVELHRTDGCRDEWDELWFSTQGTSADIWATAAMNASAFTHGRTSPDGRETVVTVEDPRVAGLAFRCLQVRVMRGYDEVDTLRVSLADRRTFPTAAPLARLDVVLADLGLTRGIVVRELRSSLTPIVQVLRRQTARGLLRRRAHTFTVGAPAKGSVAVEWSVPAAVARRSGVRVRRGVRRVAIAVGARKVNARSKAKVRVRVNAVGRRVLRRARRPKVRVRTGYLAAGAGDALLEAAREVQLR